MAQRILVTGGNSGIGFALCKQLVSEHGSHVYLGSRSLEKGQQAVQSILAAHSEAKIDLVQIDVGSQDSVSAASTEIKRLLGSEKLYVTHVFQ